MDMTMIKERLELLKRNKESSEAELRNLEKKRLELENTVTRIIGAIKAIEELILEEEAKIK